MPLVFRADDLWMELEALAGEVLFHRVGGIELSAPGNNHAALARESAVEHGIPFEWLAMDECATAFRSSRSATTGSADSAIVAASWMSSAACG